MKKQIIAKIQDLETRMGSLLDSLDYLGELVYRTGGEQGNAELESVKMEIEHIEEHIELLERQLKELK